MSKNYLLMMIIFAGSLCNSHIEQTNNEKNESSFALLHQNYDDNSLVIYKILESQKHSYITFLRDLHGNCYLVKQDKSASLKSHLLPALEKLAAVMCSEIGISAHQVEILPIGMSFIGKNILDIPGTIHTVVPGCVVKEVKKTKYRWSINQGGNQKRAAQGLTYRVIKCMSLNPDLPPIVAFDTFVANRDRSRSNLLYDDKDNKFYAIDMAIIYDVRQNDFFIPELACTNIKLMLEENRTFNKKKWRALESYYEALLKLLETFPPDKTYSLFYQFVEQSGVLEKYKNQIGLENCLKIYKSIIEKAYEENEKLVGLLAQLLQRSPYKNKLKDFR